MIPETFEFFGHTWQSFSLLVGFIVGLFLGLGE